MHEQIPTGVPERKPNVHVANVHVGTAFRANWAVTIGIDAYPPPIPSLGTAAADARAVSEVLARPPLGFEVLQVEPAAATREGILGEIRRLAERMSPPDARGTRPDRLLVYYAGHGMAQESTEGPKGVLVPAGADFGRPESLLDLAEFLREVRGLRCRHVLLVLDCCFAGAVKWAFSTRDVVRIAEAHSNLYLERYERFIEGAAFQILTSAGADQTALDLGREGRIGSRPSANGAGHSPFAGALLRGLAGEADVFGAGQGGDGLLTAHELYTWLLHELPMLTSGHPQTPGLWQDPEAHGNGEFILPLRPELSLDSAPGFVKDWDDARDNPYRGLLAYDEGDKDVFFGRDAEIFALEKALAEKGLVRVVGESGCGKSSLVKAGLVPFLQGGKLLLHQDGAVLKVPETYRIPKRAGRFLTPGTHPVQALEEALGEVGLPPDPEECARSLQREPQRRLLLVVDQFEELFTLGTGAPEVERFVSFLEALWKSGAWVVVTAKAEFEPRILETKLAPGARFLVGAMSEEQLRQVIKRPAWKLFLDVDRDLEGDLVHEIQGYPARLPLLSFALHEMVGSYARAAREKGRADRRLGWEDLGASSREEGLLACLGRKAEEIAASVSGQADRLEPLLRELAQRLVTLDGGAPSRRPASMDEFSYEDRTKEADMKALIASFQSSRLLVPVQTSTSTGPAEAVEVAHEVLIRWFEQRRWLIPGVIALQATVRAATDRWVAAGRPGFLRGSRFPESLTSRQVAQVQDSDWLSRNECDCTRQHRWLHRFRFLGVAAIITVFLFLTISFGYLRVQAEAQAAGSTARALFQAALPDRAPGMSARGLLQLAEAFQLDPTRKDILFSANSFPVRLVAFGDVSDGPGVRTFWRQGDNYGVRWNGKEHALEFSREPRPDGVTIVNSRCAGWWLRYDSMTGGVSVGKAKLGTNATFNGNLKSLSAAAVSCDGEWVAGGEASGRVGLWRSSSLSRAQSPTWWVEGRPDTMGFLPSASTKAGNRIHHIAIIDSSGRGTLWEVDTNVLSGGKLANSPGGHRIETVKWSSDGKSLVAASVTRDGKKRGLTRAWRREGASFAAHDISTSPGTDWCADIRAETGQVAVASGLSSGKGRLLIASRTEGVPPAPFDSEEAGSFRWAEFTQAGALYTCFTPSSDKSGNVLVEKWEDPGATGSLQRSIVWESPGSNAWGIAVGHSCVAVALESMSEENLRTYRGLPVLFKLVEDKAREAEVVAPRSQGFRSVDLSEDESLLAAGTRSGEVLFWGRSSGSEWREISGWSTPASVPVWRVALARIGDLDLAAVTCGADVWLVDPRAGRTLCPPLTHDFDADERERVVYGADFQPGSSLVLATGTADGRVRIWNLPVDLSLQPGTLRILAEAKTGMTLDGTRFRMLEPHEWKAKVEKVRSLGVAYPTDDSR